MCGIAGVFYRGGDKVDPQVLVRMTRTLAHRGPDEEGYFLNGMTPGAWAQSDVTRDATLRGHIDSGAGHVGLGHRRLAIIDLSSGQQPLSNEDGTVWVTFNGEIYNFQSLASSSATSDWKL